jgi:quercetin dioxygenase-like cupin family protein
MSEVDRRSPFPLALSLALVILGGAVALLFWSPTGSAASPAQQAPIITGGLQDLDLGNLTIRRFRFPAGARLGWHTHLDGPQLLMMEDGRGRVQDRGGPVVELLPNEPYVTLAGVEHWHGAAPDEGGVQWNIYDGIGVPGSVTWSRAVTEEEYNAPVGQR